MSAARTVVVVNPSSQGGRLGRRWPVLADMLRRAFPFEDVTTTAPGDATRLTRDALRAGAERVVAVGGDGTINEVINGFFDERGQPISPGAAFALVPFGTGGDFRRTLKIPLDAAAAAAVIAADHRTRIDVGRLSYTRGGERPSGSTARSSGSTARALRMFANITSFGVSGVVDRLVNASGKRLGRLSFAIATLRATWSYTNQRVELVFDDDAATRVEATINTVAIANGRFFGGAMMVAPHAEVDDGLFDVVALGDFGFRDLVTSGRRLYKGTHLAMDKVTARRARTVDAAPIDPREVVELDVDGECLGRLPARFELVPRALAMVVAGG